MAITSPTAGSLWQLTIIPETHLTLTGKSNKKDATYKWDVTDPKSAVVTVLTDSATGLPYFAPKAAGEFTITLSGSAPDGTSNSVSAKITVQAPPAPGDYLNISGMNNGGSYPLGNTYPLLAIQYSKVTQSNYFQYTWSLTKAPEGSTAVLNGTYHAATFSADKTGVYEITVKSQNVVGESAQKSITVTMLLTRLIPMWNSFFGNMKASVLGSFGYAEVYMGATNGIFKYGASKMWLPIYSDLSGEFKVFAMARVSESEVYFGGQGFILRYDGANFTKINLPSVYASNKVDSMSATAADLWLSVAGHVLRFQGKDFVEAKDAAGSAIMASHVMAVSKDLVVAITNSEVPVKIFSGDAVGWKSIAPTKSEYSDIEKCVFDTTTAPIMCLGMTGQIYAMVPDIQNGFGPLEKSATYNPLPVTNMADIAWSEKNGGLLLMDTTGQFYGFNTVQKIWEKVPGIISPPLNAELSVRGASSFNAPEIISGAGEVFVLDWADPTWKKQNFPENFVFNRMYRVPDGPLMALGKFEASGGIVYIDPTKKQVIKYEKLSSGSGVVDAFATGPNDIWVVAGGLQHFDGKTWSSPSLPEGYEFANSAVGGTADGSLVFTTGYINDKNQFLVTQSGVTKMSPSDEQPYSLPRFVALDDQHVYAIGESDKGGTVWQYSIVENKWKSIVAFTDTILLDAAVVSPTDITAVGTEGKIKHFDGTNWKDETAGTVNNFSAASSANGEVWAMTSVGELYKRDAATATWKKVTDLPHHPTSMLFSMYMLNSSEYYYGGPADFTFVGVMSN